MTVSRALLGTTVLTSIALALNAASAQADGVDMIFDDGSSQLVTSGGNYDQVGVGVSTADNRVTVVGGALLYGKKGDVGAGVDADNNVVTLRASNWETFGTNPGEGDLHIGYGGSGNTLDVGDFSTVTASGSLYVGHAGSSTGNKVIVDSATLYASENIYVGYEGEENSLTVTNGSIDADTGFHVGFSSDLNSATISGLSQLSGASRLRAGSVTVGQNGNQNQVLIANGGLLNTDGEILIGGVPLVDVSGNENIIRVSGNGSQINSGPVMVGQKGNYNTIYVQDGAKFDSSNTWIGYSDNGGNQVQVDTGGHWTVFGNIYISSPPTTPETRTATVDVPEGNVLNINQSGRVDVDGNLEVYGTGAIRVGMGSTLTVGYGLVLSDHSLLSVYVADPQLVPVSTGSLTCDVTGCQPPSWASTIKVGSIADLDGTLEVRIGSEELRQKKYVLLTADSIIGTFDEYNLVPDSGLMSAFSYLDYQLVYSQTDVSLLFASEIGEGEDLNRNRSNVAAALNNDYNGGGKLPLPLTALFGLDSRELGHALSQLSGEVGATGGAQSAMRTNGMLLGQMLNGFAPGRGGGAQTAAADVTPAAGGWSMWGSVMGGMADLPGDDGDGSHDTDTDIFGFATGWDTALSNDTSGGFAIASGGTQWNLDSGLGSGDSMFLELGAHGTHRMGNSYLSLAGAYGWHAMSTERRVSLGGESGKLDADFNASTLGGRLEAGHRFGADGSRGMTPFGALQALAAFMPGYEEDTSPGVEAFALDYNSNTASAVRGELGLMLDTNLGGAGRAFARLAWAHDWQNGNSVDASFQSLPGASFTVNGAEAPDDVALVGLGADVALSAAATLSASFDGEFAEDYQSYAGTLALRWNW